MTWTKCDCSTFFCQWIDGAKKWRKKMKEFQNYCQRVRQALKNKKTLLTRTSANSDSYLWGYLNLQNQLKPLYIVTIWQFYQLGSLFPLSDPYARSIFTFVFVFLLFILLLSRNKDHLLVLLIVSWLSKYIFFITELIDSKELFLKMIMIVKTWYSGLKLVATDMHQPCKNNVNFLHLLITYQKFMWNVE